MKEIEYEVEIEEYKHPASSGKRFTYITPCLITDLFRVGGWSCQRCEHHEGRDTEKKIVKCNRIS